jgi:hypothetical protein
MPMTAPSRNLTVSPLFSSSGVDDEGDFRRGGGSSLPAAGQSPDPPPSIAAATTLESTTEASASGLPDRQGGRYNLTHITGMS